MDKKLFFDELVFMGLNDASFIVQTIPVAAINDSFFKKANILAPLFGCMKSAKKNTKCFDRYILIR